MNAMGGFLLGVAARGLVFSMAGCLLFLIVKRPADGALVALATFTGLLIVGLMSLSPWPRWWRSHEVTEAPPVTVVASSEPPGARVEDVQDTAAPVVTDRRMSDFWVLLQEELDRAASAPKGHEGSGIWNWQTWLVTGAFVIAGLGLLRLGIGLVAVSRLRKRGRLLCEPAVLEELDLLRAEYSCTKHIDILVCDDLSTPATIGWRSPAVLFPVDWKSWSDAERRAALAHELAHVWRGDYAAGLWAQFCLVMNWFNPLAHWLFGRLRLEQELAADAWAARVSGGQQPYLTTLAQMALRSDQRPVRGPARAFLPSRDTFLRRIQMLRDVPDLRPGGSSIAGRIGALTALGCAVFGVAGLRGPASVAVGQEPAKTAASRTAKVAAHEIDVLDLVSVESGMVIDVRPAELLASPELAKFVQDLGSEGRNPIRQIEESLKLKPTDVERVILAWGAVGKEAGPMQGYPDLIILVSARPHDWESVAKSVIPDAVSPNFSGKTYWRSAGQPGGQVVYAASDRIGVIGRESAIQTAIAVSRRPGHGHLWDDALAKVADGPIRVAVDNTWLDPKMSTILDRPEGTTLRSFAPLWTKALSFAVSLSEKKGLALEGAVVCGNDTDTKQAGETLQAAVTLARNVLQDAMQRPAQPQQPPPNPISLFAGVIEPLLANAKVTTEGAVVQLRASTDMTMADVTNALAPAMLAARTAASRSQSINNLKQIALAMHNYASTYGNFPPAVVLGPDGQTPHSWRVAILPYIEQESLYQEYKLNEPWDSPNNRKVLDKIPSIYRAPGAVGDRSQASYFAITGPGTILNDANTGFATILDGTSNTVMVVEAKREVPWTKPEDITILPNQPIPPLGGYSPGGFNAAFADGSVRFIKDSIAEVVLRALFSKAGGEVISYDQF
jgi:prepilin-type processing-associated H-X9-DG protein